MAIVGSGARRRRHCGECGRARVGAGRKEEGGGRESGWEERIKDEGAQASGSAVGRDEERGRGWQAGGMLSS